jgi:beta-glucanase (GH16 family)
MTYTLSWQPDFITWAVNGVPVLTKVYDQEIKWVDMKGVNFR